MEHGPEREKVRETAAAWVVRLHTPSCTEADRAAFAAWRDSSVDNEIAYERELAAWQRLDRLRSFGAGAGPIDPDLFAPAIASRQPRKFPLLRYAAGLGFAAALVGAADLVLTAPPAYATAVGERRVVALKDGSSIELNTDSKVVVRIDRGRREVRLVRGEALFQVAADKRPFVVKSDHARLTTHRSEVAVRLMDGSAIVRVSEGSVDLVADGGPTVAVAANTEAVAVEGAQARLQPVSAQEIDRRQAWREGGVWLDGRSLSQAVEEFNRYNERKIVISDISLSGLRLGGYFRTSDLDGFVAALTSAFPIAAEARSDTYYLVRKARNPSRA